MAESFFSNLKNDLRHHQVFHGWEHARLATFNYIEVFYNRRQIHQRLGYRTRAQAEAAVP
ncbi:IS3 family transposase [Achromobacter pestifer]|uniref:IS3 family transposase n=1 Tax=Achromobacter pestifer TaxID=1353889 RepID=UPI0015843EAE